MAAAARKSIRWVWKPSDLDYRMVLNYYLLPKNPWCKREDLDWEYLQRYLENRVSYI